MIPQASQLSQEEALQALTAQQILERTAPPPVRAIQVVATETEEKSFVFSMLRNPARPGVESLDAWEIIGPLDARREIQRQLRNRIAK